MKMEEHIFDYAWKWFEYHASQRLIAFRFFLIFFGIIAVALNNAVSADNFGLIRFIGIFGCFISLAFGILEIRNEQLVQLGRDALIKLEEGSDFPSVQEFKLLSKDRKRCRLLSHKYWLRGIYGICFFGFFVLGVCPKILS